MRFYNAYDFVAGNYLSLKDFETLMSILHLDTVPIIERDVVLAADVNAMIALSDRNSAINPAVSLEGLVWRPQEEVQDSSIGRLSFKVISPKYLLKHDQ